MNRQDIAKAAADTRPYKKHLAECSACRLQVELVRLAQAPEMLVDAPGHAVQQARAIACPPRRPILQSLLAHLTFDSWAELSVANVRSLGPERERRLRFEADQVRFDLRAERNRGKWIFAAQVTTPQGSHATFDIFSGSKRIIQRSDAFYIWSAPQPPKSLRLVSPETTIILPEIEWTDLLNR